MSEPLGDSIRSVAAIADRIAQVDRSNTAPESDADVRRFYQDVADMLKMLASGIERALEKTAPVKTDGT